MMNLQPYGKWLRRSRWRLLHFQPQIIYVSAAITINRWRGWHVRRRRAETQRAQILAYAT